MGNSVVELWACLGKGVSRESPDWMEGQHVEAPDWYRGIAGRVGVACVESVLNCFRFLFLSSYTHGHLGSLGFVMGCWCELVLEVLKSQRVWNMEHVDLDVSVAGNHG